MSRRVLFFTFFVALLVPRLIEERGESYRGLANAWTMSPSRSLAGLHYVFKDFSFNEETGVVKVAGPVVVILHGEKLGAKVYKEGYISEVDFEDFEEEQLLGQSIFEATTGSGNSVGTAFLVGQDLVLTNRHVMDIKSSAKRWSCGKFSIKLNHKDERIECEKVRHCSSKYDFCIVEMMKMKNGLRIGGEVRALRLARNVRNNTDTSLLHIGNAGGLGLLASRGRGVKISKGEFFHYAPTLGGSSGAPIFNDRNEVIGLNWGLTGGDDLDDASFNRGVLSETIFHELKAKSQLKLIQEIKSFRSWKRRSDTHRRVHLETVD